MVFEKTCEFFKKLVNFLKTLVNFLKKTCEIFEKTCENIFQTKKRYGNLPFLGARKSPAIGNQRGVVTLARKKVL